MSSQTQPQNVHVACFTISMVSLPWLLVARTGQHQERSSQFPPAQAAARASRLEAALFNLGPMRDVLLPQDAELDGLLAIWCIRFLRHVAILPVLEARAAQPRPPIPWTTAYRCRPYIGPSGDTSAVHTARTPCPPEPCLRHISAWSRPRAS